MNAPVKLILLVFGFVCFVLSAWGIPSTPPPATPRLNLQSLGLAFWIATAFL